MFKKFVQICAFIEIRLEYSNSFKKFDQYLKYILKRKSVYFLFSNWHLKRLEKKNERILLTLVMDTFLEFC